MTRLTVNELADMVNEKCNEFEYLFAYRLVKETFNIWKNEEHRKLLCETGQIMADQAEEILNGNVPS